MLDASDSGAVCGMKAPSSVLQGQVVPMGNILKKASLLISILVPSALRASEADLKRARLELPKAMAGLESAYAQIRGSCRMTEEFKGSTETYRITFAVSGALRKATVVRLSTTDPSKPPEQVYCKGTTAYFFLDKMHEKPYVIRDVEQSDSQDADLAFKLWLDQYLLAPCGIFGTPMSRLIADPRCEITSAEVLEGTGGRLMRIDYMIKGRDDIGPGAIWVSPDDHWLIHKAECLLPWAGNRRLICDVTYGPSTGTIAVPRSVSYTVPIASGKGSVRFEIEGVETSPTPKSEFSMSFYGLPDIEMPWKKRASNLHASWFIILGVVAMVGAICLRRVGSRSKTA